jgi:hypothetical protein
MTDVRDYECSERQSASGLVETVLNARLVFVSRVGKQCMTGKDAVTISELHLNHTKTVVAEIMKLNRSILASTFIMHGELFGWNLAATWIVFHPG